MSEVTSSGIIGVGDVPWGAHICHFYDSPADLVDVLIPYLLAGLERNEACLCAASTPVDAAQVRSALSSVLTDLPEREQRGQLEIVDASVMYGALTGQNRTDRTENGLASEARSDAKRSGAGSLASVIENWWSSERRALERGFSGLRVTGNTFLLDRPHWNSFIEYEAAVDHAFRGHRIVALCSYCAQRASAQDVLDVVGVHGHTVARRQGRWEFVRSTETQKVCAERDELAIAVDAERRATQRLRAAETELRVLVEALPDLVWTADASGHESYFNQRWTDYTGLSVEQCLEGAWRRAVHPGDLPRIESAWDHSVTTGESYELECRFRQASTGRYRWFLSRALPLRDETGRVLKWLGSCTDIEDQKQMEAALIENDQRKDHFLAVLGHELRNPLAPIVTALQLAELRGAKDHYRKEHEVIERQVQCMTRLVNDLLDVSRITQGKLNLQKEPVELATFVARAAEQVSEAVKRGHHQLKIDVPATGLVTYGDPARLTQVVSNLLSNAAHHAGRPSTITVTGWRQGDHVYLRVRDDGNGIPPEVIDRIWDPFSQGAHRTHGGLGLGLPIVRRLVEVHGGRIHAASEVEAWTTFTVELPEHPLERRAATQFEETEEREACRSESTRSACL